MGYAAASFASVRTGVVAAAVAYEVEVRIGGHRAADRTKGRRHGTGSSHAVVVVVAVAAVLVTRVEGVGAEVARVAAGVRAGRRDAIRVVLDSGSGSDSDFDSDSSEGMSSSK